MYVYEFHAENQVLALCGLLLAYYVADKPAVLEIAVGNIKGGNELT